MKLFKRVERLVSAGGVVYRDTGAGPEVVVCRRNAPAMCGLPKGTPEPGESEVQTALREVREETGLEVESQGRIGRINYWFADSKQDVRFNKTVHFYLMSPTGGDLSLHDDEFDAVEWLSSSDASSALTYRSEVDIVLKCLSMVSEEAGSARLE